VIDYAGAELPVVDLLAFCQLGELVRDGAHQAFVIALPQGQVAFLVDAVVDIVGTAPGDVIALAAFALPRPELFSGVLVPTARPGEAGTDPYYVIDGAALAACDEVVAWSGLGVGRAGAAPIAVAGERAAAGGPAAAAEPQRRSMLTYELGVETATPLEQVSEILAYATAQPAFDAGGALLSVLVSRGRSIPVMCLARLATGRALESTAGASVLVVESDGEWVGFAVPALKAIEEARWQPALPVGAAGRPRPLALVGEGAAERMLPVLDLWQMARSLRNDSGARAH
jgi:purine-binding chemotaxis protein CheW